MIFPAVTWPNVLHNRDKHHTSVSTISFVVCWYTRLNNIFRICAVWTLTAYPNSYQSHFLKIVRFLFFFQHESNIQTGSSRHFPWSPSMMHGNCHWILSVNNSIAFSDESSSKIPYKALDRWKWNQSHLPLKPLLLLFSNERSIQSLFHMWQSEKFFERFMNWLKYKLTRDRSSKLIQQTSVPILILTKLTDACLSCINEEIITHSDLQSSDSSVDICEPRSTLKCKQEHQL